MKIRTLLLTIASLFMVVGMFAQDVIVIEGGMSNGGSLETTINNDDRDIDNRIYELKRGEFYMMHGPIEVDYEGKMITIRAEEGDGPKPVVIRVPLNEVAVGDMNIKASLTMQNIQFHMLQVDGAFSGNWEGHFLITGDGSNLLIEDCLFEHMDGILFNTDASNGQVVKFRGNYFRDYHDGDQWWGGRVINCKVPVDTLIYENNTSTGAGLTVLGQESMMEYGMINHNTFINNTKYPFLNQYWKECYYTNNLFVNANWVGEDVNVMGSGQDPDGLPHGLVGVDTITDRILLQERFYLNPEDSTGLSDDIDEISKYIWYAADNVCVSSSTLADYYAGTPNDGIDGAPTSRLTWNGDGDGPWEVVNVPGAFMNSRTEALIADHDNIKAENNSIYEYTAEEMGFGTDPLPEAAAALFIEWNRAQWGVPDVVAPSLLDAQFGDYDSNTIPGVETEDSDAGGITKISDMIEDFSYSMDLVSNIDGMPVGALHWDDMEFDSEMLTAKVKAAYDGTSSVEDILATERSKFELKNYPNPFTNHTTISFNLNQDTYVNLQVYDVSGRMVDELINENRSAGVQTVEFTPDYNASSTYFYKLTTNYGSETRKMMLLK